MADNTCVIEQSLRTIHTTKKTCTRCRRIKPVKSVSLTKKMMVSKMCACCKRQAQPRRAEWLEMQRQIDEDFLDRCEIEGIPSYTNNEYGLFGQIGGPVYSDDSRGWKID